MATTQKQLAVKLTHTCLRWVPILQLGWPSVSTWDWGRSRTLLGLGTTRIRWRCWESEGKVRVAVPVPRVKSLLRAAGWWGRCTRCLKACPWRREVARRWERCQRQVALPVGITPVILPNPLLQLYAVFRCCGGLGRLSVTFRAVAAVVTLRRSKHVWPTAQASLIAHKLLFRMSSVSP